MNIMILAFLLSTPVFAFSMMQEPKNSIPRPGLAGERGGLLGGMIALLTNVFEEFLVKNQHSCVKIENACLDTGWYKTGLLLCISRRLVAMGASNLLRECLAKMADKVHREDNTALFASRFATLLFGIYRHTYEHKNGYTAGLRAGCQEYLNRWNTHVSSGEERRLV